MSLSGDQFQLLQQALLSAFPQPLGLENMVRVRLNENLAAITEPGSLTDITFELITWAEANNRTDELVTGALKERLRSEDLQNVAAQLGLSAPPRPAATLGPPAPGKPGFLVDLSHGQFEWNRDSIFSVAGGRLAQLLAPPSGELPWQAKDIRDRRQITSDELKPWRGLLLGLPHHERIEDWTRYEIVRWVRGGGRLVLLGFELGERHHETNLNELAAEFGLRFNADMAAPAGWPGTDKPYDEPIVLAAVQSAHPVMNGVTRLCLRNLCTLTVEPGADVLLTLGENGLARLQRDGVNYTSQGWLRGGRQRFEIVSKADWVPLIAEAPEGLTGDGRVLAIGTWQLFGNRFEFPAGFDNLRFVGNLLSWLGGG